MDKRDYFIEALQAEAFKYKEWTIQMFSVVHRDKEQSFTSEYNYPYQIRFKDNDESVYFIDPNNDNELSVLDDVNENEPFFKFKDRITLNPFDLANVTETIETCYGNVLLNALLLVYPFKDKIPFMKGKLRASKFDNAVSSLMVEYPPEGVERDPKKIYIDEYLKYAETASSLAGLSQLCTASGSAETVTIHPDVVKLRDQLLKEYQTQLHDPAILAMIEEKLTKLDREKIKESGADEFFLKDKSYDVVRKRVFVMVGAETGFADTRKGVEPITKSLEEGWDTAQMPAMVNNLRHASFSRGAETALGGESVKYFYRIFQNTTVIEPDCGSINGLEWMITQAEYKRFIGLHQILPSDKFGDKKPMEETRLTEEKLKSMIGKTIHIRSPRGCNTAEPSFCAKCVGDTVALNPTGLHVTTSDVGSIFMSIFMGAMHGKALRTARFDYKLAIT